MKKEKYVVGQPCHESIETQNYLLGRVVRRAEYLREKITTQKPENPWEIAELQAMEWAIKVLEKHVTTERQMLSHFARRFKERGEEVPGRGIEPLP